MPERHHSPRLDDSKKPVGLIQRGPLAALRRLTGLPTALLPPSINEPRTHQAPSYRLQSDEGTSRAPGSSRLTLVSQHEQSNVTDRNSLHTAPTQPPSNYESASSSQPPQPVDWLNLTAPDPYSNTPSINRNIWPVLSTARVHSTQALSGAHTGVGSSNSRDGVDWTTKLGLYETTSSQLYPPPARFKTSGAHRKPLRAYSGERRRGYLNHRPRPRSRHHADEIYKARSNPRGRWVSPAGRLPADSEARQSDEAEGFMVDGGPERPTSKHSHKSSHGHTISSASTRRLQKVPSSNYHSSSQFSLGPPPRRRRRRASHKVRQASQTTSASIYDYTATNNCKSKANSTNDSGNSASKHAVQLRYHQALSSSFGGSPFQPGHFGQSKSCSSSKSTESFWKSPHSSISQSLALQHRNSTLMQADFPTHPYPGRSEPSSSALGSPEDVRSGVMLLPDTSTLSSPVLFDPTPMEHSPGFHSEHEFDQPGPSRIREDQHHPGKPRKSRKPKTPRDRRPLEYQVTELLILKRQASELHRSSTSREESRYHSLNSERSLDALSESQKHNSPPTQSGSDRKSRSVSRSPSSSSPVGTFGTFFSDWSRSRQTLPPPPSNRSGPNADSPDGSTPNSALSGRLEIRRIPNLTDSYGTDHHQRIEEIEMGISVNPGSRFFSSWNNPSSGVGGIPKEYLNTRGRPLSKSSTTSSNQARNRQFLPQAPNNLSHYDQEVLLSPTGDPPPLTSDQDETSSVSSGSWHDATNGVIMEELEMMEFGSIPHMNTELVLNSKPFNQTRQPAMTAVRRASSAAIVYDAPFAENGNQATSWIRKAALLLSAAPTLQPKTTVDLRKHQSDSHPDSQRLPGIEITPVESNNADATSHAVRRSKYRSVESLIQCSPDSKLTRSRSLTCSSLALPLPLGQIRVRGLFKPNDDPNFLSQPPHQLKRVWKKSRNRMTRALSEPTAPLERGSKRLSDQQPLIRFSSEDDGDKRSVSNRLSHASRSIVSPAPNSPIPCNEKISMRDSRSVDIPRGSNPQSQVIQHVEKPDRSQVDPFSTARVSFASPPMALPVPSSSGDLFEQSTNYTCLETLSLVPINGWCFVFGFICFPLWYVGSFYPPLEVKGSGRQRQHSSSDGASSCNDNLGLIRNQSSSMEHSRTQSPCARNTAYRRASDTAEAINTHCLAKRIDNRSTSNGPISGWPTVGHMSQSDSDQDMEPGASRSLGSMSTEEATRQPEFDRASDRMKALGGFWSEIAPRGDVEKALAIDAPMWANQRALYTWRLRCRVMAVFFPLFGLPAIVIAMVVVKRS